MSINRAAARRGIVGALLLTMVIAYPAAAVDWSPVTAISSSGKAYSSLDTTAVTGKQRLHVAYGDVVGGIRAAFYRTSADGGRTFSSRVKLSQDGAAGALALALEGTGSNTLDLVLSEYDADENFVLWYRRSTDAGATWEDAIQLTPDIGDAGMADVARAGNRVTVVYTDGNNGNLYVRQSGDGGLTFADPVKVGRTFLQPYSGSGSRDGFAVIEDEGGYLHVGWQDGGRVVKVKRSADGATWSAPMTLSSGSDNYRITMYASGSNVFVGFTSAYKGYWRASVRRSTNNGSTWRTRQFVAGQNSFLPIFRMRDGRLRVAYSRCTVADCSRGAAFLRTSRNAGDTWSTEERVSRRTDTPWAEPAGLGALSSGKNVVVYHRFASSTKTLLFARRTL